MQVDYKEPWPARADIQEEEEEIRPFGHYTGQLAEDTIRNVLH